jgi:hypothetical protein
VLCSCEHEETFQIDQISQIRNHFSLEKYEDSFSEVKGNVEVKWDNYIEKEFDGVKYYEFDTKTKYKGSIVFEHLRSDMFFKVLAWIDSEGLPHTRILKFLPFIQYELPNASYLNASQYSGLIYVYDMQAGLQQLRVYYDGKIIDELTSETNKDNLPSSRISYCGDMTRRTSDIV